MRLDYLKIKRILHIVIFSLDFLIFILVLFSSSSKSKNFKEYTGVSKFFLDFYIMIIYAALIANSIFPKLFYIIVKRHFRFILTDKGKVIISFLLSMIYWFCKNKPQLTLGVLLLITSIILLIYELISMVAKFEEFLGSKGIEIYNKEQVEDNNNSEKPSNNQTPENNHYRQGSDQKNGESPVPNMERDVDIS